jgi:hypothetical protein
LSLGRRRMAVGLIYFIATIKLLIGVMSLLTQRFVYDLQSGWAALAEGLGFLVLGRFASQGARLAFQLAGLLWIIDTFVWLSSALHDPVSPAGQLVVRGLILWGISRGL